MSVMWKRTWGKGKGKDRPKPNPPRKREGSRGRKGRSHVLQCSVLGMEKKGKKKRSVAVLFLHVGDGGNGGMGGGEKKLLTFGQRILP